MGFTTSTIIGILTVGLAALSFILYRMNVDQCKTIKSLELKNDQLWQQNGRLLARIDNYSKSQGELEKELKNAVVALNTCEVKLHDR